MNAWRILCAVAMALAIFTAPTQAKDLKKYKSAHTSRDCLTRDTRVVLEEAEAHFGRFEIVSTCRPGAVIAGSGGKPSEHRFGRAVDFKAPPGASKAAIVKWLYSRTRGLVMTYRSMPHIHFDTGPYHKISHANY